MRLTPGAVIENCSPPTDRLRASFRPEHFTSTEARDCWMRPNQVPGAATGGGTCSN